MQYHRRLAVKCRRNSTNTQDFTIPADELQWIVPSMSRIKYIVLMGISPDSSF